MYSYEDRMRAVELYIKLGERVGATIRQLGYPTENALKAWYQAYQGQRDLPRGYVRLKPKYSQPLPFPLWPRPRFKPVAAWYLPG